MSTIAVIGAGSVGAQVAYSLTRAGTSSELFLVDIDESRCKGEVLDIEDASFINDTRIRVATFKEAATADIIIITAGAKQRKGEKREELLARNYHVLSSIWASMESVGPETVVLLVANPVDVLTAVFQRISGLPAERVIGTGTFLDSMRLRRQLSLLTGVAASAIHAYIVGEHGDLQVPLLSMTAISGVPLSHFDSVTEEDVQKAAAVARDKAEEIIRRKGATFHGIAACAGKICSCVLHNRHQVFQISVFSKTYNTYLSLPAVLGKNGVDQILPLTNLSESESSSLKHAAETISSRIEAVLQANHPNI